MIMHTFPSTTVTHIAPYHDRTTLHLAEIITSKRKQSVFGFDCNSFMNGHNYMNKFELLYFYGFVLIRERQIK